MGAEDNGEEWKDTPENRIKLMLRWMLEYRTEYFDNAINTSLSLLSARVSPTDPTLAHLVFSFTIPQSLCNASGNLHGGACATIFDTTTSMCIAAVSKEGFWDNGHVSRALNVSYLRPVPSGTEIRIECEGVHLGRKLAMVRGRMVRVSDGKVCYVCEHQKAALEKDAGSRL